MYIDEKFSTYKGDSEISLINKKQINESEYSTDMKEIFFLAEETKKVTNGYFDIQTPTGFDPSGIVKGWAIRNVAEILKREGVKNFYVDAGGDIEVSGRNKQDKMWSVGIRSPFNPEKDIVKIIYIKDKGVATSGTYVRGRHIYDPHNRAEVLSKVLSMTVIGPDAYEADRFATAAFAMGEWGINFIEKKEGFEGYMIDSNGVASVTTGFNFYTKQNA